MVPELHPSWLSNLAPSHRWSRWHCWRLPPHKATGQEDVPETPPLDLRLPPTLELSGRHPCPAPPHCSLTLCPTTQVSTARTWPHGFSQPPGAVCSAKATLVSPVVPSSPYESLRRQGSPRPPTSGTPHQREAACTPQTEASVQQVMRCSYKSAKSCPSIMERFLKSYRCRMKTTSRNLNTTHLFPNSRKT